LHQAGRIAHRLPHLQEPLERPAPLSHWHLDVKDASTVPADPDGKRQHVGEVLNTVDEGTSVLVGAQVGADLHAETTVGAVAELFMRHGLPEAVRRDRDGRCVSSPSGSDFPPALVRFCQGLGVSVFVCDPRHPHHNGFVESYHRTFQEECLAVQRPVTLEEVREATTQFEQHYNYERPHQGRSCGNCPPRLAFPMVPELPAVPDMGDPDRWLRVSDGFHLVRLVRSAGTVRVESLELLRGSCSGWPAGGSAHAGGQKVLTGR
jgi:Integrase core domain